MAAKNSEARDPTESERLAYGAGQACKAQGAGDLKSNPHPADSDEAKAWEAGFKSEKKGS